MAKEIERKFLVADDTWRQEVFRSLDLRDGLISATEGRKVRVRLQGDQALLTVKGRRNGLSRDEYEYPIPHADAVEMIERHCGGQVVEKTRHFVQVGPLVWTVDVYRGILAGVTIAEVELPSVESECVIPAWAGREVTGLQEYRKVNMVAERLRQAEQA